MSTAKSSWKKSRCMTLLHSARPTVAVSSSTGDESVSSAVHRGGHAPSPDTEWTMLVPGVELQIAGSRVEVAGPHARMVLRCPASVAAMLDGAAEPVQGLPTQLSKLLSEHRFAVHGPTAPIVMALAHHAAESVPHNVGLPYSDEQLLSWQQQAASRRFEVADAELLGTDVIAREASFAAVPEEAAQAAGLTDLLQLVADFYTAPVRPYASAGGLYPISVIAELKGTRTVRRADQLVPGPCAVEELRKSTTTTIDDPTLHSTTGRLWLVADLDHLCHKYGPRGYRYALIEAGEAGQFFSQLAGRSGLQVRPFGGYDDAAVADALGLTEGQVVVHCLGVRRAPIPTPAEGTCVTISATTSSGVRLHLATTWANDTRTEAREILIGQAVDGSPARATAKAYSELAERIALTRSARPGLTSNGMSAHPHPSSARRNAALELYERHCLLSSWYSQAVPERLTPPAHAVHQALVRLAAEQTLTVRYGRITDPRLGIPAVVAVLRSTTNGAILLGSAAADSWESAKTSAAFEVVKAVLHRRERTRRFGEPFFEPHRISKLDVVEPWQHESYWANDEVPSTETSIYECGDSHDESDDADPALLAEFFAGFSFEDCTSLTTLAGRAVYRAENPTLLPVRFGSCPPDYVEQVRSLIGHDPSAHWPHPLG